MEASLTAPIRTIINLFVVAINVFGWNRHYLFSVLPPLATKFDKFSVAGVDNSELFL